MQKQSGNLSEITCNVENLKKFWEHFQVEVSQFLVLNEFIWGDTMSGCA